MIHNGANGLSIRNFGLKIEVSPEERKNGNEHALSCTVYRLSHNRLWLTAVKKIKKQHKNNNNMDHFT